MKKLVCRQKSMEVSILKNVSKKDNIPTLPDFNKIVIIEVFVILSKLIVSLITKGPISDSKMQGLLATFHQFSPIG